MVLFNEMKKKLFGLPGTGKDVYNIKNNICIPLLVFGVFYFWNCSRNIICQLLKENSKN